MADVERTPSNSPGEGNGTSIPDPSTPSQPAASIKPEPTLRYSWRERHPNVQIKYISDHQLANTALEQLQSGPYGFDLEWKPCFTKGQKENRVALVQIANHETILLLQIKRMREFPSKLKEFLFDPEVTKVGVGIQGDAEKLYRDWKVDITSCVDLALLARTVDNDRWKGKYTNPLGLARLIAVYEDRILVKGKITRSDWEKLPLNEAQKQYAANDAHAGYVLYMTLISMLPQMSPQPEAKCYSFDAIGGNLYVSSERKNWEPSNPDYDPGPLPPPREPKPPKTPKSRENLPATSSDRTQSLADCGSGNGNTLPALQSNANSQEPRFRRGGQLQSTPSTRGSYYPRGYSQPGPSSRGAQFARGRSQPRGSFVRGYRGGPMHGPPNHMQPHFLQYHPQSDLRHPYYMVPSFGPTGFSPSVSFQPGSQNFDAGVSYFQDDQDPDYAGDSDI